MGPAAVEQGREGVSSGDVVLRRQAEGQTEVTSSLHHQASLLEEMAKECSAAEDSHAMALELLFKEQNSLEQVLKTKEKLEDDLLATVVKLEDDAQDAVCA